MLVLLIFALSSFTPISSFTYLSITIDVLSPMLYVHVHTCVRSSVLRCVQLLGPHGIYILTVMWTCQHSFIRHFLFIQQTFDTHYALAIRLGDYSGNQIRPSSYAPRASILLF